jgi:hypothetical protein
VNATTTQDAGLTLYKRVSYFMNVRKADNAIHFDINKNENDAAKVCEDL